MTYDCKVCHSVNHARRLSCQACGTIPAVYSILRKESVIKETADYTSFIEVTVAFGAERSDRFRTTKSYLRTVPLDYYAEV